MNAPQHNLLTTGRSVSEVMETITAKDVSPPLAAANVSLNNIIDEIETLSGTQGLPIPSTTQARNEVVALAGQATLVVAGLVGGYARAKGLTELAGAVAVRPSTLVHGRLNTRLRIMQQVYDAAAGVATQLAAHGLTEAKLDDLKAKIAAASDRLDSPRGAIVARRVATEKLAGAFDKLESVLRDELDPLMEAHRETDPDGYLLYRAARVVIDRPGQSHETEPTAGDATVPAAAKPATTPTTSPLGLAA